MTPLFRQVLGTAARTMSTHATHASAPSARVLDVLKRANAVCFDVDSTVITVEGIDELASFAGKKEEVAALTRRAMGGSVPFHEALDARLKIIQPTSKMLEDFIKNHPFEFTDGFHEIAELLKRRGTSVYLVSGGFTQMIHPVADVLGLPRAHVYANTILFDGRGDYAGFDREAPTSRAGGKAEALRQLKTSKGYTTMVMVGDGATDLEARPPADVMVGYGGIAVREAVVKGADWFVKDWQVVKAALQ